MDNSERPIKSIARSLAHNCEAAFRLLRKRLERAKLNGWVLPHAYRALGKHVHQEGAFRAEFPDLYVRLNGLNAEIALLLNQPPVEQQATTFMAKAHAAARAARHPLALLVLNGRIDNAFGELGKAAFEKMGDQGEPSEATRPILDARAGIEKLDLEIVEPSQAQPGQIVTPNLMTHGERPVLRPLHHEPAACRKIIGLDDYVKVGCLIVFLVFLVLGLIGKACNNDQTPTYYEPKPNGESAKAPVLPAISLTSSPDWPGGISKFRLQRICRISRI